jgi:hypothetical protein
MVQFVVYDHPKDWPDFYVVRKFETSRTPMFTSEILMHRELEPLQDHLARMGLVKLMPDPTDDPVILEIWL